MDTAAFSFSSSESQISTRSASNQDMRNIPVVPEICPFSFSDGIQTDNLRQSLSANHLLQTFLGYRQTQIRLSMHLEMLRRMEWQGSIAILLNRA